MDLLNTLLKRFEHIQDPRKHKEVVCRVIDEVAQIKLTVSQIHIKKSVVEVKGVSGVLRNVIFFKKIEIIKKLQEELPKLLIDDIH